MDSPASDCRASLEPDRLTPGTKRDGLADPGTDEIRNFLRPEPAAVAADAGKSEAHAVVERHCVGLAIEQRDPGPFQHQSHLPAPESAAVVIAEDRDFRHAEIGQQIGGEAHFRDLATFGEVTGDDEQVGLALEVPERGYQVAWNFIVNVQVSDGGNPYGSARDRCIGDRLHAQGDLWYR